ncbi:hypothetical protein [Streptomyces sp. TLI_146]|uniref:hypothetical protein n=1 Tax=Streptomyces sp. TLI_146 TaxID=1938858 RepID=UPI0015D5EC5E|nr:hypothetical protein [Streptomyces sp. TLI_146]
MTTRGGRQRGVLGGVLAVLREVLQDIDDVLRLLMGDEEGVIVVAIHARATRFYG